MSTAIASVAAGEKPSLDVAETTLEQRNAAAPDSPAPANAEPAKGKRKAAADKPKPPPADRLFDEETAAVDTAPPPASEASQHADGRQPEYLGRISDDDLYALCRVRAKAVMQSLLPTGLDYDTANEAQRQPAIALMAAIWKDEVGVTGVSKLQGDRTAMLSALKVFDGRLGIDPTTGEAESDAADDLI